MTPTIEWIKTNFAKLNKLYFNNELPTPKFRVNHARRFWGVFYSYRATSYMTARENSARHGLPYGELCISDYDHRPELDKLNTLLHEMVHLWQFWNELPDHGHGRDFKRKAAELNKFGWQIQRVAGHPSPTAWANYNSESVEVHTSERLDSPSTSRKIAALKRSIAILEAKQNKTASDYDKLYLRQSELHSLVPPQFI